MPTKTRGVTFRFNNVFYPEYVSTILISLLLTVFILTIGTQKLFRNVPIRHRESHLMISGLMYAAVVAELLRRTATVRLRHRYVRLIGSDGSAMLRQFGHELPLDDIDRLREQVRRQFGRRVRVMTIDERWERDWCIDDTLFGYDALRSALLRLRPEIPYEREFDGELDESTAARWAYRHAVFPPPTTLAGQFAKLAVRMLCLIPVGVIDVVVNVGMLILMERSVWLYYSAPISLAASAVIARYIYFYAFSSTRMNQPANFERPSFPDP